MKTITRTIAGSISAQCVARALIHHSQWFILTPLPDDFYGFEVKVENAELLDRLGSMWS